MTTRYNKFLNITKIFMLSKTPFYHLKNLPYFKNGIVEIGHYKFNSVFSEHPIMFNTLVNQNPCLNFHTHGKRLKKTITLTSTLTGNLLLNFIDRFINTILPVTPDLQIFRFRRSRLAHSYQLHLNRRFEWTAVNPLISDRVSHKENFLPTNISLNVQSSPLKIWGESYLRMFRYPVEFYRY